MLPPVEMFIGLPVTGCGTRVRRHAFPSSGTEAEKAAASSKCYMELMGVLIWCCLTHPDCQYYVSSLCQLSHGWTTEASPIRGAVNPANVLTKFTFGSVFIKERRYIMGILHD